MEGRGEHAVVLGGSIAGVFAARVLAERFERVTIVERDELPEPGEQRRGVPQGRHVHALLARGTQIIDELFPGATLDLVARGALLGRVSKDATLYFFGSRIAKVDADLEVLSVSRPLLEGYLRARVLDLAQVSLKEGCSAHGLIATSDRTRVTGVRLLRRADGSPEETLAADLVVDATGRGSHAPAWLEALGYTAPPEDTVKVDVTYTSCRFPRLPGDEEHAIIVGGKAPIRRGGGAHAEEGDRWIVTLAGRLGEQAPADLRGFTAYAETLPINDLYELIRDREPLTEPVVMRYPASRRRRYESLERFPDGFVVVGDALCSFNPIYGQGMSVAAIESGVLADTLDAGLEGVGRRFFAAASPVVDVAWEMALGGDLQYPEIQGPRTRRMRVVNGYLDRLTTVASRDPVVAAAFLRVIMLTERPESLLHPRISLRVLVGRPRRGGATTEQHRARTLATTLTGGVRSDGE